VSRQTSLGFPKCGEAIGLNLAHVNVRFIYRLQGLIGGGRACKIKVPLPPRSVLSNGKLNFIVVT